MTEIKDIRLEDVLEFVYDMTETIEKSPGREKFQNNISEIISVLKDHRLNDMELFLGINRFEK